MTVDKTVILIYVLPFLLMPFGPTVFLGRVVYDGHHLDWRSRRGLRHPSYDELNGQWFDWANDGFRNLVPELRGERKDAPTTGVQTARYGYVHINRDATDAQALAEITRSKVKPATDLEVVYFGKQFPEEQRKYPIVGLGSFFPNGDDRNTAVLFESAHERSLSLDWDTDQHPWHDSCRFLVRE